MKKFKVTFYPDKKSVEVDEEKTILSAAISAGVHIDSVCGGDGVCGRCKVIVRRGEVSTQPSGLITNEERKKNIYLACITTIHGDLEIEIPASSRAHFEVPSGVLNKGLEEVYAPSEEIEPLSVAVDEEIFSHSPLATKLYLEIPPPELDDKVSDLDRLYRAIKSKKNFPLLQTGLTNIRGLSELLRRSNWKVTVTLGKRNDATELVLIEPQDTSAKNFGLAIDIGTTTVSVQLVDLISDRIIGTRLTYNKQASFGSDVISRIIHAQKDNGLEELHLAVTECLNQIIEELISEHNIDLNDVTCVLCAGNTTMIHLLLRIDPSYIRRQPYVPTANLPPTIRASEAGIRINPRGLLSCVPGVASYVGGDAVAGVLSCGLYKEEDLGILIDIGTNGEIVLGNKEFLVACAASAGPAFEGSGVSSGMRATSGAIQSVKIDPKTLRASFNTIGNVKPSGICGSGYIDLLAEMLRSGVMDKSGKINAGNSSRIRKGASGLEFIVVPKEEAGEDILITEADIDNLKRAKAAIYSATSVLVKYINFDFLRVSKIFIAGGFGNFLNLENAIFIGLLPDIEREKLIFVGNSSLAGGRLMLLSSAAMKRAREIARKITYFELSVEPRYMEEYMAALFFPHTDFKLFPSVKAG
ncbi:MAG: ASKHA domain-containing protein [Candidatus Omnitrophica bacterium]|nr:ASKHA domain-containing protein [Candidatus Omnitrophota bacterium]